MRNTLAILSAIGALFIFAPRANASANAKAERLIKTTEKLSLKPYQDEGGTWHAGWGHKLPSKPSFTQVSKSVAERWLREDIGAATLTVENLVQVPLNANQKAALVSFVYNVGGNAFKDSTLLAKLNTGDYEGAAAEFKKWVYVKGNRSTGLMTRREAEKRVFLT